MSEQILDNNPLIEKLQKFMKITAVVMIMVLVIGGVGGWLIYENNSTGMLNRTELLIPVIIATVFAGVGLRMYRGKLFSSKQEFKEASALFKQKYGNQN